MDPSAQAAFGGIMARERPALSAAGQKRVLADLAVRDRIVRKADGGRRLETIRDPAGPAKRNPGHNRPAVG